MGSNRSLAWWTVAACLSSVLHGCGGGGGGSSAVPVLPPPAPPPTATKVSCDESMKTTFKPDANTSVLLVKAFKQGDQLALPGGSAGGTVPVAAADMCLVKLLVGPGNAGPAGAPSTTQGIGIEIWLPSTASWNKRLHLLGGAGMAGGPQTSLTSFADAPTASPWLVAGVEGAVAATTDTGHVSGGGELLMNPDGTVNTLGWQQFSQLGIHEMTLKAKALAIAYFGEPAKYTYWHGGSTGGRQGLKQAQAYPEDFDGIIATAPAINWSNFTISQIYPQIVIQRDLGGVLMSPAQLTAVSAAAINACDLVGGAHLGYLLNPAQCTYDPATDASVLCTSDGGSNSTASCLTLVQATAVNKIWYGPTTDGSVPSPAVDNGLGTALASKQIWYGFPRGADLSIFAAGPRPFSIATDMVALYLQDPTWAGPTFVNATGNGANRWKNLSYEELTNAASRGIALQPLFSGINTDAPDLAKFRDRGGKLITYVGSSDQLIPHAGVINYYHRVAAQMGGIAAAQAFYKLYLVPGMGHFPANGTANPNANPPLYPESANYKALTDWVENGIAPPDKVDIGSPITPSNPVAKTGPMCLYPKLPVYSAGDIHAAGSYACS